MQGLWFRKKKPKEYFETMDGKIDRHATWLELFFDLVFVIAVSSLSDSLLSHVNFTSIGHFIFLFIPIWWIWMGISYYSDQFEDNSILYRIMLFVSMLLTIRLSIFIPNVFLDSSRVFALIYIELRAVLIILYIAAWRRHPIQRPMIIRYIIGFSLDLLIWFVSVFVPDEFRFILWAIALCISIATPIISYITLETIPAQVSHMDERFGLFTLIVLGEIILLVTRGIEHIALSLHDTIHTFSGFCCAIVIWALYFNYADDKVIHRSLRSGKKAIRKAFTYGYSHLFIFISITAFGISYDALAINGGILTPPLYLLIFGSAILYILSITLIQWAMGFHFTHIVLWTRIMAVIALIVFSAPFSATMPSYSVLRIAIVLVTMMIIERWHQLGNRQGEEGREQT